MINDKGFHFPKYRTINTLKILLMIPTAYMFLILWKIFAFVPPLLLFPVTVLTLSTLHTLGFSCYWLVGEIRCLSSRMLYILDLTFCCSGDKLDPVLTKFTIKLVFIDLKAWFDSDFFFFPFYFPLTFSFLFLCFLLIPSLPSFYVSFPKIFRIMNFLLHHMKNVLSGYWYWCKNPVDTLSLVQRCPLESFYVSWEWGKNIY